MRKLWTGAEVSVRLYEAVNTLQRLPMPRGGMPAVSRSGHPDVVRDAVEAYGYELARTRPAAPSPRAIERMEEALGWLLWVEGRERIALFVTSFARWDEAKGEWRPISLRKAGRLMDASHEAVRQWRASAVGAIVLQLMQEAA